MSVPQNKRTTGKEQYYTPDNVSEYCLSIMDKYVVADQYLEPAGGTGSFIRAVGIRVALLLVTTSNLSMMVSSRLQTFCWKVSTTWMGVQLSLTLRLVVLMLLLFRSSISVLRSQLTSDS